jgi:hypothetical protein
MAATTNMERRGSKIDPKSEREACNSSGPTIAPAATMAPTALDRTIIHGRITPHPVGCIFACTVTSFNRDTVHHLISLIFS